MVTKANKKFQGFDKQSVLTEATILDPRFKKKGFTNNSSYQQAYEIIK